MKAKSDSEEQQDDADLGELFRVNGPTATPARRYPMMGDTLSRAAT
jgi:hypothetical protein